MHWPQRLHRALMPDYNRRAAAYWWLTVLAGHSILLGCLVFLAVQPSIVGLQVLAGVVLALLAGLFPLRVPGTRTSLAVGEIVIFGLLLVHGAPAATVAAAVESATGSYRTSRRWTSRIASPALAALALFTVGSAFSAVQSRLALWGWSGTVPLMALTMATALVYFLVSAMLFSGLARVKRGEPFLQVVDLISVFRWVGMAYAASAAMAALLVEVYRQAGPGVWMVMLPLLAMLLVTLHFYFRHQEVAETARRTSAELAEREAAMTLREAEVAERHLRELRASERRFHSAFTHAGIGMALLAFDGRILQANAALAALLQGDAPGVVGRPFLEWVDAQDAPALRERLGLAGTREFEVFALELRCRRADGQAVWVALHCSFFNEPESDAHCLIVQVHDIQARRAAEAGLQHLAFHDPLTGLPNRRRFVECLEGAVARRRSDAGYHFAVMFLDFDRFKLVNDSLGHSVGDELLVQLARRIQARLRPGDIVARLGGDEFALLAERFERERDAVVLAERVLDALAQPFAVAGHDLVASASIGITFSSFGYDEAEAMLRDADTAMYKAKLAGKARVAVFDSSLHAEVSRRLRLEGELRQAIERGHLGVAYQPMFDLVGGRLIGLEALVRWSHPAEGSVAPASFLPVAEDSGMMSRVTDFVLHDAMHRLRAWQQSNPAWAGLTMSVNVAAEDLADAGFVARVTQALIEAGVHAEHLTLELTENILMSRIEGARVTLAELRRLGVRVAVDDFGTGYSSLSHLARLPIDILKIDRSFIAHLQSGVDESAVVRSVIQLGQSLRKEIVAEGIETQGQLDELRALGCAAGQGFLLGEPKDDAAMGHWLALGRLDAQAHWPARHLH